MIVISVAILRLILFYYMHETLIRVLDFLNDIFSIILIHIILKRLIHYNERNLSEYLNIFKKYITEIQEEIVFKNKDADRIK